MLCQVGKSSLLPGKKFNFRVSRAFPLKPLLGEFFLRNVFHFIQPIAHSVRIKTIKLFEKINKTCKKKKEKNYFAIKPKQQYNNLSTYEDF